MRVDSIDSILECVPQGIHLDQLFPCGLVFQSDVQVEMRKSYIAIRIMKNAKYPVRVWPSILTVLHLRSIQRKKLKIKQNKVERAADPMELEVKKRVHWAIHLTDDSCEECTFEKCNRNMRNNRQPNIQWVKCTKCGRFSQYTCSTNGDSKPCTLTMSPV